MKKAVFEVATLADAVAKANRVAPNKGAAFDRAAGIVLDVDPRRFGDEVYIMSTDLDVTFRQHVSILEIGDEPVQWRVPSSLFNGVMSTLPMGSGSQVLLAENGDGNLYFRAGKTKAKLRLIMGDYPKIEKFDADLLAVVPNFARRLQQVAWACDDKASGILGGVHLDGTMLFGCNRLVLAMVPCVVPVDRPVTAPLADIAALIKNTSEVSLRAAANHMEVMPDAWTQATSVLYEAEYPKVQALMTESYTQTLDVPVEALKSGLDRMMVLANSERYPVTTFEIGDGYIKLEMEVPEVGKVADEIEVKGGNPAGQDPLRITFTPTLMQGAILASGRQTVTMDYGPTNFDKVRIKDDNQFCALIMPRAK